MNPKEQGSVVDDFFNSLPSEDNTRVDIFEKDTPPAQAAAPAPEKGEGAPAEGGEGDEPRKNRRHRRLEEKLQAERESNIALAERVKVLSEVEKFTKEHGGEVDPRLVRAFGLGEDGKPSELTRLMNDVILDTRQAAKKEALAEIEARQQEAQKKQKEFEGFIDSEFEYLEEEYKVDLTSNAPAARKARREFLDLVQSVSPKDESGEMTGWADFDSTFRLYQKTQKAPASPTADRQKEIAARTMQRPGAGNGEPPKPTPGFFGWKKDFRVR